ncbi:MAG: DUF4438 domain-containing protein [bacterium]|nr:DUF4438 domain-containing protein [bacterium]
MRTNRDRLLTVAVGGEVAPAAFGANPYDVTADGRAIIVPGMGSVNLNVRVDDPALGWVADHVEPAVSARARDDKENVGFCLLACVGNRATVMSGEAKGATGVVTGKHGGIEHVLIDFPDEILERLAVGDKISVRASGQGLALPDLPSVRIFNLDPDLFERLGCEAAGDRLRVRVAKVVPAAVMGSGLGRDNVYRGDYDIQMFSPDIVAEYALESLRLGDVVAIQNAEHSYGRIYKTGAVSIGVVAHGASAIAGHGPGVTSLMTSGEGKIDLVVDPRANIAEILGLR